MEARAMGKDPASTEEKDKIEATAKGGSLIFFVYPKEEYEVSKVYTNKYYVTIRLYSQTPFEIPGWSTQMRPAHRTTCGRTTRRHLCK